MRIRPFLLFSLTALLLSSCDARQKAGYFPTGEIEYRAPLNAQGLFDGEVKYFYQHGSVSAVLPYRNDRIEGLIKRFYPSGQLESTEFYKNGETFGPVKHYYATGQLKHESTRYGKVYRDTTRSYHPNGELDQMIIYDGKGRRVDFGLWRPDGKMMLFMRVPFFCQTATRCPKAKIILLKRCLGPGVPT